LRPNKSNICEKRPDTNKDVGRDDELFYLYGEDYDSVKLSSEESGKKNTAYLYDIFIKS